MTSISGSQYSVYDLVDQYMQLESMNRDKLVVNKNKIQSKKDVYSQLDVKLSSLQSKLDYWLDSVSDYFAARKLSSSDSDKLTATVTSDAVNATHTVSVERLAVSDTRVSNQFDNNNSSFTGFSSDETFSIEVGHPTDEDAANRETIDITIDADTFSKSDDDVLSDIADAINEAMQQAVNNETIDSNEVVSASVVHEETGQSRLVLSSTETGYTYRMDFGSSSLLDFLNVNNNAQTSGATGGYITAVGSNPTESELNSKFIMDGLTFYRDSNSVNDAVDGVTIKMANTFSEQETLTISTDVESVTEDVNNFMNAYNEVISFLRSNTQINSTTYQHGALQSDFIYSGMVSELTTIVIGNVDSTESPDYTLFYDIGIEIDRTGKLSITDSEKFEEVLDTNSDYIKEIFTSENGIATKLDTFIEKYVKTGGIIDTSEKQVDEQVQSLEERIDYMDEILATKEKQYFTEFTKLQETMYLLENQQAFFNAFMSGLS